MNSTTFTLPTFVVLMAGALALVAKEPGGAAKPGVREVGRIADPRVTECSGIVASRQHPGTFWIHNDGGGPKRQILYAISRDGHVQSQHSVPVPMRDWEDIAIDAEKRLYLADTGNNERLRTTLAVHQTSEPDPTRSSRLEVTRSWLLRFPASPFDCESLFIWGTNGYVVSKVSKDRKAEIHRFPLTPATEPLTLEFVAKLRITSPVTGADISPDGRLLGVVAKSGAFVFRIDGDVASADKSKPHQTNFRHDHIEGCTFVPEGLLATAESREIFLFTDEAFRAGP